MNTNIAEIATLPDLDSLMAVHLRPVWLYLRSLGCEPELCDDLSQEVFVGLWKRLSLIEDHGQAAMAAYLRSIARSRYVDHCRRSSRVKQIHLVDLDALDEAWLTVMPDASEGDVRLEALRDCLSDLSERERQAIDLRFKDECSGPEIAAALGTSEDGAWSLLKRVRARLRSCLLGKLKP